jgi:hypothetical protein
VLQFVVPFSFHDMFDAIQSLRLQAPDPSAPCLPLSYSSGHNDVFGTKKEATTKDKDVNIIVSSCS